MKFYNNIPLEGVAAINIDLGKKSFTEDLALVITNVDITKGTMIVSIGTIEERKVTYDELAQLICDGANYKLADSITGHWLGKAVVRQTNFLSYYSFHLAIVESTSGSMVKRETKIIWKRKVPSK